MLGASRLQVQARFVLHALRSFCLPSKPGDHLGRSAVSVPGNVPGPTKGWCQEPGTSNERHNSLRKGGQALESLEQSLVVVKPCTLPLSRAHARLVHLGPFPMDGCPRWLLASSDRMAAAGRSKMDARRAAPSGQPRCTGCRPPILPMLHSDLHRDQPAPCSYYFLIPVEVLQTPRPATGQNTQPPR